MRLPLGFLLCLLCLSVVAFYHRDTELAHRLEIKPVAVGISISDAQHSPIDVPVTVQKNGKRQTVDSWGFTQVDSHISPDQLLVWFDGVDPMRPSATPYRTLHPGRAPPLFS